MIAKQAQLPNEAGNHRRLDKMARLFLREQAGIDGLLNIIANNNLAMTREALEYACETLSDDWLTLFDAGEPNCICDLSLGKNRGGFGCSLSQWAEVVASLYEVRCVEGLREQVRRLCIPSHERLDTACCRCCGEIQEQGLGCRVRAKR
jgi:hypothetical protein